jgi:hypothetical protein
VGRELRVKAATGFFGRVSRSKHVSVMALGFALTVGSAVMIVVLYGLSGGIAWNLKEYGPDGRVGLYAEGIGLRWSLWDEHPAGGPRYERVEVGWPLSTVYREVELGGEPPLAGMIRIRPDRSAAQWLLRDIASYRVSAFGLIGNATVFAAAIALTLWAFRQLRLWMCRGRCHACGYLALRSGGRICSECGARGQQL